MLAIFSCACDNAGRPGLWGKPLQKSSFLDIFKNSIYRRLDGRISLVYRPRFLIFCMNDYISPLFHIFQLSSQNKNVTIKKHLFLGYFGHFSGSWRLILTHPTYHWSYIMSVGSDTSVGTFPRTHHRDENPFWGSLMPLTWVIFTRSTSNSTHSHSDLFSLVIIIIIIFVLFRLSFWCIFQASAMLEWAWRCSRRIVLGL